MDEAHEQRLVTWTYLIYGLHALSLIGFIFDVAIVVGAFVPACPSIVAVILNYMKRRDVSGTWLESHFRWQFRTFWYGLLCALLWTPAGTAASSAIPRWVCTRIIPEGFCLMFLMLVLGAAFAIASIPLGTLHCPEHRSGEISGAAISDALTCAAVRVVSLWLIYRLARGWLALKNRRPMYALI